MHDPDSLNIAGTNIFDPENQQAEREHRAAIAARWQVKKVLIHLSDNPPLKDPYAYKDIKPNHEIRVLKLYAGAPGSKLVCCLIPSSFQSPGSSAGEVDNPHIPYDALSYYWGDAHEKPSHEIYVLNDDNAHSGWSKKGKNKNLALMAGRMLIRTNLKDALEQLRSEQDHVLIWADAVCINQENIKERTAQVARMHDVYSQAKKVHIWLGNPKDEIENKNVFNFLRTILDLKELDRVVERLEQKSGNSSDKSDRQNCKSAIELMQAKWFSRRWVIQELALATNAHVRRGKQEMPWSDFADAIALFMTKYDQIKRLAFRGTIDYSTSLVPGDHHINSLEAKALGAYALVTVTNDLFRKSNQGIILQRLLSLEVLVSSMLLAFEATDPKDTVFAVLQIAKDLQGSDQSYSKRSWGLIFDLVPIILFMMWTISNRVSNTNAVASELALPKTLDKRIEANYRKCLADVCADFIEYCIESSNSLDILCRHWAPVPSSLSQSMIVEMPSWILPITGNAFGGPSQSQRSRVNGDSFVRGTERGSHYSASGSIPPSYKFGKTN
ncbi:heterokaryon incompatibility protein-domain-containing protein, partial [Bisporella sp. PMI_857]